MAERDEIQASLERVTGPAEPAPDVSDLQARQEASAFERAERMTKSSVFRSNYLSEREVADLRESRNQLDHACRDLRQRLDEIGPRYAALRQAFDDARGNFTLAALLMTAGGLSVSVAGTISDPTWKPILLWSGITGAIAGFILAIYTLIWIRPAKK